MQLNIPALDLVSEEKGKWFKYRGEIRFKIARIGNDAYLAGAAEMYELTKDDDNLNERDQAELMAELYSRYILMDWDGVVDKDTDKYVKYDHEVGKKVLRDEKYKDALKFILRNARSIEEYWQEDTKETAKK
jgi:hypothetical protein